MTTQFTARKKIPGLQTCCPSLKTVALTAFVSAFFVTSPVGAATMLVNGGFEVLDDRVGIQNSGVLDELAAPLIASDPSWDVFATIPGWTGIAGAGIEIQTNRTLATIDAHSGGHYVELDSHGTGSNSSMSQDITLDSGTYQLSFWYSPRNSTAGSNQINYSIGTSSGSASGPGGGTAVGVWTQITETFTVAAPNTGLTLTFQAAGTPETLGGLIDDVSITAVPIPAAAWLFGSAIMSLIVVTRRKNSHRS